MTRTSETEIGELAAILADAFMPTHWPAAGRAVARIAFSAVLRRACERGVIAVLPGRAACVLSPPRRPRCTSANPMQRLGRTCWRLSNFGARPIGGGAGTILLTELCDLADRRGIDLCLRARVRSASLYRRAGFENLASHGTVMLRRHRPREREREGTETTAQIVFLRRARW